MITGHGSWVGCGGGGGVGGGIVTAKPKLNLKQAYCMYKYPHPTRPKLLGNLEK